MNGVEMIARERKRQIDEEGFTSSHDDCHALGEIAMAAACYAAPELIFTRSDYAYGVSFQDPWPWGSPYDKRPRKGNVVSPNCPRKKRITLLVKAGALIAAEIDRLLRLG